MKMTQQTAKKVIGQRMTPQRRLLLDIIEASGRHLDADELFMIAKRKDSRISLSTVYRNLNLLKEMGLVAERHFVEDHHHYEMKGLSEHCHLVCKNCGTVFEFETPLTNHLRKLVTKDMQFDVGDVEISIQGICAKCAKKIRK